MLKILILVVLLSPVLFIAAANAEPSMTPNQFVGALKEVGVSPCSWSRVGEIIICVKDVLCREEEFGGYSQCSFTDLQTRRRIKIDRLQQFEDATVNSIGRFLESLVVQAGFGSEMIVLQNGDKPNLLKIPGLICHQSSSLNQSTCSISHSND